MKKHNLLMLLVCLIGSLNLSAQATSLDSVRSVYQSFFNYSIPGDVLAEIAFNSDILSHHKGKSTDSTNSTARYRNVLKTLRNCSKDLNSLPSSSQLNTIISSYRDDGLIPISIVDYTYSTIDSSILNWSGLSYDSTNNKISLSNDPSSFINENRVKIFTFFNIVKGVGPHKFILPSSLFFSNRTNPDSVFIDFNDGQGYRTIMLDQEYAVNIDPNADYLTVLYKSYIKTNNPLLINLPIMTHAPADAVYQSSDLSLSNPCYTSPASDLGEARVYIKYGVNQVNDQVIRRPFILIEGFDLDRNPNDDRYGDINYGTLVTGLSFNENNQLVRSNLRHLKYLSSRLYNADYDIIFIDFKNGAGDMFKNGNTVIKLIQWVNENKEGNEELIVMGASMGGLLARYALRSLELADCHHCTKLYGTFDSPHKGANIPLSLQYAVNFFKDFSDGAEVGFKGLQSPAAQQLLIHNITAGANEAHYAWQSWLNTNGQPQIPRRIALTNGSPQGLGPFPEGDNLYSRCVKLAGQSLFYSYLYSSKEYQVAFEGMFPIGANTFHKWANAIKGVSSTTTVYSPAGYTYYDHAAGGQAEWIKELHTTMNATIDRSPKNTCANPNGTLFHEGRSCFVPIFSALDFYSENRFPNLTTLFPTVYSRANPNPLHPFHSIYYHSSTNSNYQNNQLHVFFDNATGQNIDWIMNELEKVEVPLETVLPSSAGAATFNYNKPEYPVKHISSIAIEQGGKLHLNGDYRINYGLASDPFPMQNGDLQKYETSDCASYIEVLDGGIFEIGDGANSPVQNKAEMRITKGSVLHLKSGSELIVHNGSSLIIEQGGVLIYENNAHIILDGLESSLVVEGHIQLMANAVFKTFKLNNGLGYIKLIENDYNSGIPFLVNGAQCEISLTGNSQWGSRLLWIDGSITTPQQLKLFKIEKGSTLFSGSSGLVINCSAEIRNHKFEGLAGSANHSGIELQGNQELQNCLVTHLDLGVKATSGSYTNYAKIKSTKFIQCNEGLYIQGGSMKLEDCIFSQNQLNGLVYISDGKLELTRCSFKENFNGLFQITNSINRASLILDNCSFIQNALGLRIDERADASLSCCLFSVNNSAITLAGGSLGMSPLYNVQGNTGGQNTFYDNAISISGTFELFIEQGGNNFLKSAANTQPFISGNISATCSCINPLSQLNADNNYWYPQPNGLLEQAGPYYYQLQSIGGPHPIILDLTGSYPTQYYNYCISLPADFELELSGMPNEITTGIKTLDNGYEKNIHIRPNPASNNLYLDLHNMKSQSIVITLVSPLGQVIWYQQLIIDTDNPTINIKLNDQISAGLYTLKVVGDAVNFSEKVLIKAP